MYVSLFFIGMLHNAPYGAILYFNANGVAFGQVFLQLINLFFKFHFLLFLNWTGNQCSTGIQGATLRVFGIFTPLPEIGGQSGFLPEPLSRVLLASARCLLAVNHPSTSLQTRTLLQV